MSEVSKTTTDQIAGEPNRNRGVVFRCRLSLIASTNGPSSLYAPYYYAEHTLDLSFLNTAGIFPDVKVWRHTGSAGSNTFIQCPYTFVTPGALTIAEYTKVQVAENISKTGGYTLGLTIALFTSTLNLTREYYITVGDVAIGSTDATLFTDFGTFSA
jgi:hypothetical protein